MIYFFQILKKTFDNITNKDILPNFLEQTVLSSLIAFYLFFNLTQNSFISLVDFLYILPLVFLFLFLVYYFWYVIARSKDFEINISKAQAVIKERELDELKGIRVTVKKQIDLFKYSLIIDALTLGLIYIPTIGFSSKLSTEELTKGKLIDYLAKFIDLMNLNESELVIVSFLNGLLLAVFIFSLINKVFLIIGIITLINFLIPWELILNSIVKDYIKKLKPYVFTNIGLSFISPTVLNEKPKRVLIGTTISILLGFISPILTVLGFIGTNLYLVYYSLYQGKNP